MSTQGPFWYLALHQNFSTTLLGSLPCKEIAPVTHVVNEVVSKLSTPFASISPVRNKNKSDFRDWETVLYGKSLLLSKLAWGNPYNFGIRALTYQRELFRCWLGIQAYRLPKQLNNTETFQPAC